jgi:hypothetical protein
MTPNHALQRTLPSRSGCNPTPSWAGSLSLGRSAAGSPLTTLLAMVFADLKYPGRYEDIHDDLLSFLRKRFDHVEGGLQGDSWIWVWLNEEKVAVDTFSSMTHQIKSG